MEHGDMKAHRGTERLERPDHALNAVAEHRYVEVHEKTEVETARP
jgi:hypothetical protein